MSTISIVAILQTGERRGVLVPANSRTPLHVTQGESMTLIVDVEKPTGAPVSLTGGSVVLTAKLNSADPSAIASLTATLHATITGRATFTIAPATFKYVTPGRYVYDIWFTDSGGARNAVVPLSPLFLEPTVTPVP